MLRVDEAINFYFLVFSASSDASQSKLEAGTVRNAVRANLILSLCVVFRPFSIKESEEA